MSAFFFRSAGVFRLFVSIAMLAPATVTLVPPRDILAAAQAPLPDPDPAVATIAAAPTVPNRYRVTELPQPAGRTVLLADNSVLLASSGAGVVKWQAGVTSTLTNTVGYM